jgi:hypothetical protein
MRDGLPRIASFFMNGLHDDIAPVSVFKTSRRADVYTAKAATVA